MYIKGTISSKGARHAARSSDLSEGEVRNLFRNLVFVPRSDINSRVIHLTCAQELQKVTIHATQSFLTLKRRSTLTQPQSIRKFGSMREI